MKRHYKLTIILLAITLALLAGCSANEKAMVDAVKSGDTVKVQSLLDKGVSPNLKTDNGQTILMLAVYLGHTDIVKSLIEKGADVNAKDNNGKTALMYAAEKGNIEMARLLLEKGADINAADNKGKTALQTARENNQTTMVEFLSNWGKPVQPPSPTVEATATPTPTQKPVATTTPVPTVNPNQQLKSVFFDFDKSTLRSDQTGTMETNLAILKENPEMHIILGGHASERGTRDYNIALSERRAKTIQKHLIENGIAPERIIIYPFGEDYPLKKGSDEASRSYNRRVDILKWDTILTEKQVIELTIE